MVFDMDLLFGYGSLINRNSAERTLNREVGSLVEAILLDHHRNWSARETVICNNKTLSAAFLNVIPKRNSYLNGVCLSVTRDELKKFDCRERNYKRVNISQDIVIPLTVCDGEGLSIKNHLKGGIDNVWTYIYDIEVDSPAIVLETYQNMVYDGCRAIGKTFYSRFLATTDDAEYPLLSGPYQFSDPDQERHV